VSDRRPTGNQQQRVLAYAQAGRELDQREWFVPPDGGDAITRLSAVVWALERDGHHFHRRDVDGGWTRYTYAGYQHNASSPSSPAVSAAADAEQRSLLTPPPRPPRSAIYDWDEDG
jgi:hypothetical protein